ncbi:unnamed protein product [Mytilus edulis]|uniref:ZSWIM1/3 RNaseH-like domain-containing protein n=1 Tax=Mytilus edulis TaxID=6550 RepID=A0A8S3UJ87_MYTED|nr:unnamed protein product [Mytilus edulis]
MDVLRNGDRFYDFEDVLKKIREYEIATNTNFYRRDSRTIAAARKRGIKRNIKPELLFYSITLPVYKEAKDIKIVPREKDQIKGTIGELFASEDNVLQGLFYQDKEMLQNFENYPEILFIDSTFKVNNLRMPLYVFLVEDSMGQSEIAGLCFLAAEEKQLVDHMGNLFKKI